jgi:hypothetical protein
MHIAVMREGQLGIAMCQQYIYSFQSHISWCLNMPKWSKKYGIFSSLFHHLLFIILSQFLQYKANPVLLELICLLCIFALCTLALAFGHLAFFDHYIAGGVALVLAPLLLFLLLFRRFIQAILFLPPMAFIPF